DMVAAAVVGVMLNLSLWFAIHVLFQTVERVQIGPVHMPVPQASTLDGQALALVGLAAVLGLGLRWSSVWLIPTMAGAGVALSSVVQTGGAGFVFP
ncbi:MAG: hypothetical protein ACPGFC_03160, partial [Paracoccaceae bacterium]